MHNYCPQLNKNNWMTSYFDADVILFDFFSAEGIDYKFKK